MTLAMTVYSLDPSVDLEGEYIYEDTLDLGQVYDINVQRRLVSGAVTFGTLFDRCGWIV
jgi:hypothetical protein